MAEEIGAKHYMECSSLRMQGVDDVFEAATRQSMLTRSQSTSPTSHAGLGKGSSGAAYAAGNSEKLLNRRTNSDKAIVEESKTCCVIV